MATKIIHKKSSVSGRIPQSSDLEVGELALNLEDRLIYSKQSDGTVVEMSPSIAAANVNLATWTLGNSSSVGWAVTEAGGTLAFKYGTSTAMSIDANGNIDVGGDVYTNAGSIGGTTSSDIGTGEWGYHDSTTNFYFQYGSTNLMRITSGGDLYISGDLDINQTISGNTATSYYFSTTGGNRLEITTSGDVYLAGDVNNS